MQVQYTVCTAVSANSDHYVTYSFEQNGQTVQLSLELLSLACNVTVRGHYCGYAKIVAEQSSIRLARVAPVTNPWFVLFRIL